MKDNKNEMIYITMYADDTRLFSEYECNIDNTVGFDVPRWILEDWYKQYEILNKDSTMIELGVPEEEATFDKWFNSVCICEDFDGFYDYCIIKGIVPNLLEAEYNIKRYKICYEKPENNKDLFSETSVHVFLKEHMMNVEDMAG